MLRVKRPEVNYLNGYCSVIDGKGSEFPCKNMKFTVRDSEGTHETGFSTNEAGVFHVPIYARQDNQLRMESSNYKFKEEPWIRAGQAKCPMQIRLIPRN